jgi:hypothetical protein
MIIIREGTTSLLQDHIFFITYNEYNKTEKPMEETIKLKGNTIILKWLGFSSEDTL